MKRLTIFCGHYGSGKTNLAVNYALHLRKQGKAVTIADLDIVNPYFRTKDSEAELTAAGVKVISLPYANTNVDLPSIPSEAYALVQDRSRAAVMDLGGDDRGAYALGRFAPAIREEADFAMLYVANFYRPLTRTAEEAYAVMREISAAAGLPFTGIVNNSNLGEETTAETVAASAGETERLSALSGLPIVMTSARADIAAKMTDVFPLRLQDKYW